MSPGVEKGLSVRTTGGEGDRRVTRSLRKGSNMEKHEAMDGELVRGEQEVVDGPWLGRAFIFAWADLGINTDAIEPLNKGQLWSHAMCLSCLASPHEGPLS